MSFLQDACAKFIADKVRRKQSDSVSNEHRLALRLMLVEEECDAPNITPTFEGNDNLAQSLAMDFAYSLVSSSPFGCRGCYKRSDNTTDDLSAAVGCLPTDIPSKGVCKCCKVALLIPGELRPTKKKRRRNEGKPNHFKLSRNGKFPMCFVRDGIEGGTRWDPTLLGQIQIKYVTSLADVIGFLAYATSLPDHLQPLDGIFLLGVGEILPKQNVNMELTHLREYIDE